MYDAYDSMQLTGEPTGVGGNKCAMNERARGTDGGNGDVLRASLWADLERCVTLTIPCNSQASPQGWVGIRAQSTSEPTGVGGNKCTINERARRTDRGNGDALRASLRVDLARCMTLMSKPAAAKCRGYGQLMGGPISA